jgi:hypothetical protein
MDFEYKERFIYVVSKREDEYFDIVRCRSLSFVVVLSYSLLPQ